MNVRVQISKNKKHYLIIEAENDKEGRILDKFTRSIRLEGYGGTLSPYSGLQDKYIMIAPKAKKSK